MKKEKLNQFLSQMKIELNEAENKHPKFANKVTDEAKSVILNDLKNFREMNELPPFYADDLFYEEFCEFLEAYQNNDFENALMELAQCGAVILRMMEFVENKINEKK